MVRVTFQAVQSALLFLSLLDFIAGQLHDESFPDHPSDAELGKRLTKDYRLKQGIVRGLVLEPRGGRDLGEVEVFLGLPYAAAPVGSLRFMPPVSATHWTGLKQATSFAPVCPQTLPELKREDMSAGRFNYMKRLLPFLRNQSEDCLYLNVYVPSTGYLRKRNDQKYPVMIFIHGESYEWNSGNPYDGTVLAAYGKIIVITINFRLGLLGFMKPSVSEDTIGNFGLLDQIAALHWVKENIAVFNGDPGAVTLAGHGTGAACVNFLMVSPVANGLFHRAILMSGSALSDWSLTSNPILFTVQVAQSLNCPTASEQLAECLRRKKLSDIMAVRVLAPKYTTPFGPIVDHSVIPNEPAQVMGVYKDLFSRYDLLYGCTEMESYHLLGAVALAYGMLESERNALLRLYTQAKFEYEPDIALAETLKEYTTFERDMGRSAADTHRDNILDILSDAQIVAPLVQTANFHSKANPKSYFYVFGHNSLAGEYAALSKSVHGEELAYMFGVPLGANKNHFREEYSPQERLLSEAVMTYWTNFAKTGNPNVPRKRFYLNMSKMDWERYGLDWPQYNHTSQSYIYLGIPPQVDSHYRETYMRFWNENLPRTLNHTKNPFGDFESPSPIKTTPKYHHIIEEPPEWVNPSLPKSPVYPVQRLPGFSENEKFGRYNPYTKSQVDIKPTREDPYKALKEMDRANRPTVSGFVDGIRRWKMQRENLNPITIVTSTDTIVTKNNQEAEDVIQTSALTMHLIIAAGVLFLLINICAFALLYYKKRRLKSREREMKRINTCVNGDFPDGDENVYDKDIKNESGGCNMFKALKSSGQKRKSEDIYEPVKNHVYEGSKTPKSDDSGGFGQRFKLRRQMSSSTLDAHTKVRDWIANEIVQRCSPNFLRKADIKDDPKILTNGTLIHLPVNHKDQIPSEMPKPNCKIGSLTGSLKATTDSTLSIGAHEKQIKFNDNKEIKSEVFKGKPQSNQSISSKSVKSKHSNDKNASTGSLRKGSEKPQKVSVAVDATPATRSNSVLNQEPIELTKSLDYCFHGDKIERCGSPLRRSQTMEDIIKRSARDSKENVFKSTVNLKVSALDESEKPSEIIKIIHKHSASDPVKDMNYTQMFPHGMKPKPGSFNTFNTIQPPVAFRNDINMTSRDEIKQPLLTPAEALMTIKRRNYPKVLPDLPKPGEVMPSLAQKRLSLPPQSHLHFLPNSIESSPCSSEVNSPTELKSFIRGPPLPPPRSSSTLGRKHSQDDPHRYNSFERSRTLDRHPNHTYIEMHSNTLPKNARIDDFNYKQQHNKPRVNMIDIERSNSFSQSEQSESEQEDNYSRSNSNYEAIRPQPKLIISANPTDAKINERKLIIRPNINKNINKTNIPRVLARDNSFECDDKIDRNYLMTHSPKHCQVEVGTSVDKIESKNHAVPDSKGPSTVEELERFRSTLEKGKEIGKIKLNPLTRQDGSKGPDIRQANDTKNAKKTSGRKEEKPTKIPKTPVMGAKHRKDQKSLSPKAMGTKSQLKIAGKISSIPQPVPSQISTNELNDMEHASESSNDTECSTETVKKVK